MRTRSAAPILVVTVIGFLLLPSVAHAAPPVIERQWVSDVSAQGATLNVEIDPEGQQTYYELQIDTTGNFKFFQTSSCPISIAPMICAFVVLPGDPLAPGLIQPPEFVLEAEDGGQRVSLNMADAGATLQPETTYHYRAIAVHADGELVEGPDQTFTTPLTGNLPDPPEPPSPPDEPSDPPEPPPTPSGPEGNLPPPQDKQEPVTPPSTDAHIGSTPSGDPAPVVAEAGSLPYAKGRSVRRCRLRASARDPKPRRGGKNACRNMKGQVRRPAQ